jgi:hypothetical protein
VFPVSVSLGVYKRGKGNGWWWRGSIELIASAIVSDHASLGQLSQAGANRGGAQAAELAQLLDSDGLLQAGQDLLDALESRWFRTGLRDGGVLRGDWESQRWTGLSQLDWDVVLGDGGPVFSGQSQLGAAPAHVKIGVTPAVEFAWATQGLAGPSGVGIFSGVVDD